MVDCIFCKIAKHEVPKEFIYEDEEIMVFPDIYPIAKVHLLVIPKKHIEDFLDFEEDVLLSKLKKIIQKMVKKNKLENRGYRLTINGGGAQILNHLHIHLTGPLGKPAKM